MQQRAVEVVDQQLQKIKDDIIISKTSLMTIIDTVQADLANSKFNSRAVKRFQKLVASIAALQSNAQPLLKRGSGAIDLIAELTPLFSVEPFLSILEKLQVMSSEQSATPVRPKKRQRRNPSKVRHDVRLYFFFAVCPSNLQ